MTRIARCCCQACSIEVEGDPTLNAVCNCSSCKRRTGSAFGWSAYFHNEDIKDRRGEFSIYVVKGPPVTRRWFCANCGTTMMWENDDFVPGGQTGFAAGCFAETPLPEPNLSAYDDRRCAWLALPETWTRFSPP
jgi:hypothetical protein